MGTQVDRFIPAEILRLKSIDGFASMKKRVKEEIASKMVQAAERGEHSISYLMNNLYDPETIINELNELKYQVKHHPSREVGSCCTHLTISWKIP